MCKCVCVRSNNLSKFFNLIFATVFPKHLMLRCKMCVCFVSSIFSTNCLDLLFFCCVSFFHFATEFLQVVYMFALNASENGLLVVSIY